ncbi:hypothetical protein GGU11DRAFT_741958 [Lentinula aff. detonsa]|nr:hypothetical protein GGU11DRAFT_741958 [Lentinula aff. detonsa]
MSEYSSSDSDQDLDYWGFTPKKSYFPISNARDTPWTIEQSTQASRNRRERCSLHPVSTRRIVELPVIHQISNGFLRENGRLLYTAKHSSVLRCLEYARTHWHLPVNVPDGILALAALETFLHPFDPVHWLFWSIEQRDQSAKLVQSHIGRRNPTIYHPLSWSILDWKFRLSGIHNKQLPDVLRCKPWYDTLVLSTYLKDLPMRGPVLRKRKVQPPTKTQTNTEQTNDMKQLPAKRSRHTRAQPSHKAALPTDSLSKIEDSSLNIPTLESSVDPARATSVTADISLLSQHHANASESTGRSITRLSRKSPNLLSARATSSTSSSPTPSSTVLLPSSYSRTRSSSRLSARTLVGDIRDLSPSNSSATTAADSSSAKGKQKAVDEPVESEPRLIGVIDVVDEDLASLVNTITDGETDLAFPRLTRSRSGATKTEVASSGPQRSQLGRKNRAKNLHPYLSEKAARGLAPSNPSADDESIGSEALVPSQASRRSRKAKSSRR